MRALQEWNLEIQPRLPWLIRNLPSVVTTPTSPAGTTNKLDRAAIPPKNIDDAVMTIFEKFSGF